MPRLVIRGEGDRLKFPQSVKANLLAIRLLGLSDQPLLRRERMIEENLRDGMEGDGNQQERQKEEEGKMAISYGGAEHETGFLS